MYVETTTKTGDGVKVTDELGKATESKRFRDGRLKWPAELKSAIMTWTLPIVYGNLRFPAYP